MRPGLSSAAATAKRLAGIAVAMASVAMLPILAAAPVSALAETPTLGEPEHEKAAILNEDGTATVTLSVTGETASSQSKSSANVIVVLDTSGSMNDVVARRRVTGWEQVGRWEWASGATYGLVDGEYVLLTRHVRNLWSYYYTYDAPDGSQVQYTGSWYQQVTRYEDVTRLDVAKGALSSLADQLIGDGASTIGLSLETFSGYGEGTGPSAYYHGGQAESFKTLVNGLAAEGGTNWTEALDRAKQLAIRDTTTPTYILFLSDGEPTYGMVNGRQTGNGKASQPQSDLQEFFDQAVTSASTRPSNVVGLYTIYTGADAATSMHDFAKQTNSAPDGTAFDGTDSEKLNSALADIAQVIETGVAYQDVTITDTLSHSVSYVLPEGETAPEFTYTRNGEPWADAPAATVDADGRVSWSLGDGKTLEHGVIYAISFKVHVIQEEFDRAAETDGAYEVATNENGSVSYRTVTSVTGSDPVVSDVESASFDVPTITVPTSKITVSKAWEGSTHLPQKLTVTVRRDGEDYKTVDLSAENNWTADATVSAGPTGHSYTVVEETPDGWTSSNPDGIEVSLKGLTAQSETAAFTNTYVPFGLRVFKYTGTGDSQRPLQGATFTVEGNGATYTLTTGEDGYATTGEGQTLSDGTYTITETSVPAGYDKLPGSLTLTVDGETATLSDGTQSAEVGKSSQGRYFQIAISNTSSAPQTIPQTGGLGSAPLYALGMAAVAGIVALTVRHHQ
ncbi:DUF7604 domain-containing protein [Olsenella porci]|uniref:Uncharacterized protein n=1 Tax=Olsenella porci TaxID=2652279 RepID=A0A6N7XQX5_9ACTN|nr:SpaA isopeptide-forming pilin-related protein [Olsenella porci]MST72376.1 hypothetical protein [Olsenella porci]